MIALVFFLIHKTQFFLINFVFFQVLFFGFSFAGHSRHVQSRLCANIKRFFSQTGPFSQINSRKQYSLETSLTFSISFSFHLFCIFIPVCRAPCSFYPYPLSPCLLCSQKSDYECVKKELFTKKQLFLRKTLSLPFKTT